MTELDVALVILDPLVAFISEAAELAEDKGCESVLAFATSALREAPNGATVVALVEGQATVKRFYRKRGRIHLVPANERMEPIVAREEDVELRGVVVALVRRYR